MKHFSLAALLLLPVTSGTLLVSAPVVAFAEDIRPSSTPKVYLGPDGERVTMLEVNASTQMLVKFDGVGGKWEGTTQLWSLETLGADRKNVYFQVMVDDKPQRYTAVVLLNGRWFVYLPERANRSTDLRYSMQESKGVTVDSLIQGRRKTQSQDGGPS